VVEERREASESDAPASPLDFSTSVRLSLIDGLEPPAPEGPFDRPILRRVLPFALLSLVAEASLALSPSSVMLGYALVSVALYCAIGAAFTLPWSRWPRWSTVLVPLLDVVWVVVLVLATGSATSGVGIIVLVPLVWCTLYHRRWESLTVLAAIVVAEVILGLTPVRVTDAALFRRAIFFSALGLVIVYATHALRHRLQQALEQREASLRRTVAFADAAEELTSLLHPDEVLSAATRLAAELVSPSGSSSARRSQYNHIEGDMIRVAAQYDESGQTVTETFALAEQPNLVEVLRTGKTTQLPVSVEGVGPTVRALIESLGVTNSVYIPIHLSGRIDGILSVGMRGGAVAPELLDYCSALGHLVELALENAHIHTTLEEQATTDNLTGLPNQRAFGQIITNPPGRIEFSILVIDLDSLKSVNDTLGHRAGDEMLVYAAEAMESALRQGDVVARIGGDEFAALLYGASRDDALLVGQRILDNIADLPQTPLTPSLSIGIALGTPDDDFHQVLAAADVAMYRAKRGGGGRVEIASSGSSEDLDVRHDKDSIV
jgi:diguanylate cyclase (GGDEF)-like protein